MPRREHLIEQIEKELFEMAKEAFDPEKAVDSDGLDQAERDGILAALTRVKEIIRRS